jgi:hypothetical protein
MALKAEYVWHYQASVFWRSAISQPSGVLALIQFRCKVVKSAAGRRPASSCYNPGHTLATSLIQSDLEYFNAWMSATRTRAEFYV